MSPRVKKPKKEFLAVIPLDISFLMRMFNEGLPPSIPVHGVRDIECLGTMFDKKTHKLFFLVSSPDIPAYVGYHKTMEDLKYFGEYPELVMIFTSPQEIAGWTLPSSPEDMTFFEEEEEDDECI